MAWDYKEKASLLVLAAVGFRHLYQRVGLPDQRSWHPGRRSWLLVQQSQHPSHPKSCWAVRSMARSFALPPLASAGDLPTLCQFFFKSTDVFCLNFRSFILLISTNLLISKALNSAYAIFTLTSSQELSKNFYCFNQTLNTKRSLLYSEVTVLKKFYYTKYSNKDLYGKSKSPLMLR